MQASDTDNRVVDRRSPRQVMRLARLGSMHQSRLSFMRVLIRRMHREQWRFSRPVFEVDGNGVGHAVVCAHGPERTYSLVAFFHDLPDDQRSDRVIAEAWDTTFALHDGVPTAADIERLADNVPLQEAGRISERELSLSRANRSVRLWTHVIDSLACGQQPQRSQLESVGYLMRTTAVYGSGKFGAADRQEIASRPEFASPFQVEMLAVYLIRTVVRDLVQHMADRQGGDKAVTLAPELSRLLGIGNSTGLGMAPFLLNHPVLFNNWMMVREEAIARVRNVPLASISEVDTFKQLLMRSNNAVSHWTSAHPLQQEKLSALNADILLLDQYVARADFNKPQPWNELYEWAEKSLSVEGQEYIASLMLEPYGELVDDLAHCMSDDSQPHGIDGSVLVSVLKEQLEQRYDWALAIDWQAQSSDTFVWYTSEEKLEPRLGNRYEEPLDEYEQPLSPGRDIARLHGALSDYDGGKPIAEFLMRYPEHRHAVRRLLKLTQAPYGEILDNTIGRELLPIDLLRCKLSFFGATRFDPRSDRWVRICLYSNAPYPEELVNSDAMFWPYPEADNEAISAHS